MARQQRAISAVSLPQGFLRKHPDRTYLMYPPFGDNIQLPYGKGVLHGENEDYGR